MCDFSQLRKDIPNGIVLLPGQEGYEEVLDRWSVACVKRAVRITLLNAHAVANHITDCCRFAFEFTRGFYCREIRRFEQNSHDCLWWWTLFQRDLFF